MKELCVVDRKALLIGFRLIADRLGPLSTVEEIPVDLKILRKIIESLAGQSDSHIELTKELFCERGLPVRCLSPILSIVELILDYKSNAAVEKFISEFDSLIKKAPYIADELATIKESALKNFLSTTCDLHLRESLKPSGTWPIHLRFNLGMGRTFADYFINLCSGWSYEYVAIALFHHFLPSDLSVRLSAHDLERIIYFKRRPSGEPDIIISDEKGTKQILVEAQRCRLGSGRLDAKGTSRVKVPDHRAATVEKHSCLLFFIEPSINEICLISSPKFYTRKDGREDKNIVIFPKDEWLPLDNPEALVNIFLSVKDRLKPVVKQLKDVQ